MSSSLRSLGNLLRNCPTSTHSDSFRTTSSFWNLLRPFTQSFTNLKKKKRIVLVPPLNEADLVESFVRGSGPGGQAVNKTNNAVSLIHQPTGIRVQAHTHRSREANRNQARRVLAERVDYYVNRGKSQIEKMWKREQKKKLAKIRKRKKKEKEEEVKTRGANDNVSNHSLNQQNKRTTTPPQRNHETLQHRIPKKLPVGNPID